MSLSIRRKDKIPNQNEQNGSDGMPKQKPYYQYDIPSSVVEIVKTICADYNRREQAIKFGNVSGEVLDKYIELNAIITAALEDVEFGIRMDILRDIQNRRGYDFSPASYCISKNTYYKRKKKLIYDIAKRLALI